MPRHCPFVREKAFLKIAPVLIFRFGAHLKYFEYSSLMCPEDLESVSAPCQRLSNAKKTAIVPWFKKGLILDRVVSADNNNI